MKLERAELRAAVQATEAAAEDTGGKVMDASFAEFLGILNGVDRISKTKMVKNIRNDKAYISGFTRFLVIEKM